MSVDKFGRHRNPFAGGSGGGGVVKGLQGEGFKLTPDGHFDISNKLLRNVASAITDDDAVNLKTLNTAVEPCIKLNSNKRKYDALGNTICNLKDPEEDSEPVTKKFLNSKILKKLDGSYSTHQFRIQDLAYPQDEGDAVNLKYITEKCLQVGQGEINVKNRRIADVSDPVKRYDAVNKWYLDRIVPHSTKGYWSFDNKRLVGVRDPLDATDAVNKQYFVNNSPKLMQNAWVFGNKRLHAVADPESNSDAVNVNYLVRVLSDITYTIYKKLAQPTDEIFTMTKDSWISVNIINQFFIDPHTRVVKSVLQEGPI